MSNLSKSLRATALGAFAVAVGAVGGAMASTTTPDSTSVGFISITPHRVLSNVSIASRHSSSPVVIGGSTTVPTDATTVRLSITAHSVSAGTLAIYSAGNPLASGDHFVSVPKGGSTITASDNEHPGTANEVTITNTGTTAIVVTISITGYSTQVNAGSIDGSGGTAGQVLVNNGDGTTGWRVPGQVYAMRDYVPFQVWGTANVLGPLNLPPGSYDLSATLDANTDQGGAGKVVCGLVWYANPFGTVPRRTVDQKIADLGQAYGYTVPLALSGQLTTVAGGRLYVYCVDSPTPGRSTGPNADVSAMNMSAVPVGRIVGDVTTDDAGIAAYWPGG